MPKVLALVNLSGYTRQVYDLIKDDPRTLTAKEISEIIGKTEPHVRNILGRLTDRGIIKKVPSHWVAEKRKK
jgi:DNA-binding Lrp family transcriptional regulator